MATRRRKTKRFKAQVDDQVRTVRRRLLAVQQQSTIDVLRKAQETDKTGGTMRVKTGFLRHSLRVSLDGMPFGPIRGEEGKTYDWESESQSDFLAEIAKVKLGRTIYAGWTANYARPREYRDNFLRRALQKWQQIVERNAERAVARIRMP